MKHQQVVVDYWTMLKTSCTCLLLAISGYVLIKMVQTIFYLPGYLKNNQKRLEELAAKYNLDLEKEIADAEIDKDEEQENKDENQEAKENLLKNADNVEEQDLVKEPKKLK
ncbi:uncharacterized protein LOC119607893 [Lucilia sericata]|uniref:uncharacterized protein LOC119607893 n=1 Tax=Lucilia sericata TaxID=13632 RepID=UPI0018A7FDD1|nr:uncharacterized protein LOC119607893 [Lucilia sericata]